MATEVRGQVWAKTDGHCWYCGKLMNPWGDFTVDHMDPQKHGGSDEIENLIPACSTCNSRKNAKTVEQYRGYLAEKQSVRFWGEQIPIANDKSQITGNASRVSSEKYPRPYEELIKLCMYVTPYENPTLALTLLGLMRLAAKWGTNPDRCGGILTFDDLQAVTHVEKPRLLSNVCLLAAFPPLTLQWGHEDKHMYFILDFRLLDEFEPWHWSRHQEFSAFVAFH